MSEEQLLKRINALERRLHDMERIERYTNAYDDLMPSAIFMGQTGSPPSYTIYNGGTLRAWEFPHTNLKSLSIGWQFWHAWDLETAIYPHLHLYVPAGTTGDIKFTMYYSWCNINEAEPAEANIYGVETISSGATSNGNLILALDSAAINPAGRGMSSMLVSHLHRDPSDAADTFDASVWLKSADIHAKRDGFGSRQEYIK